MPNLPQKFFARFPTFYFWWGWGYVNLWSCQICHKKFPTFISRERETETERDRERQKETERDRDRERDRQRQRETERRAGGTSSDSNLPLEKIHLHNKIFQFQS